MTQFDTARPGTQNDGITNGREIAAYVIADLIKLAAAYSVSAAGLLTPLYTWMLRRTLALALGGGGGVATIFAVSTAISVVWGAVMLGLFLALRGALGGVPTIVCDPGRERAVTSSGSEIGAFVLAYGGSLIALMLINFVYLRSVYTTLGRSGQHAQAMMISLSLSLVSAIIIFFIFIGLRRAFSGGPQYPAIAGADGEIPRSSRDQ